MDARADSSTNNIPLLVLKNKVFQFQISEGDALLVGITHQSQNLPKDGGSLQLRKLLALFEVVV